MSVLVPTIGRPALLRACLGSLAECEPRPAEVIVVDQSPGPEVEEVVAEYSAIGARALRSRSQGVGPARNEGIEAAGCEFVAVTDDDCTVSRDWIATADRLMRRDPAAIYTGTVLAPEGAGHVPSTIDRPAAIDFKGMTECRVLYPNNMVFAGERLIRFGGFDTRLSVSAEDNDFCYRWLRAGRRLVYEPRMRVWHHDWRTPSELRTLYMTYGRGQGAFYAKHLARGDLRMLRFVAEDVAWAARATLAAAIRRDRSIAMPNWMMLRGLPDGLRSGLREFARR